MLDDREQLEAPSRQGSDAAVQGQPGSAGPVNQADEGQPQASAAKPPRRSRLRVVAGVAGLLALGAGAYFGHSWWTTGRYMVATDDAYVGRPELDAVAQGLRLHLGRCRRGQRPGQGRRRHRPHRRRRLRAGGPDRARPDRGAAGHHPALRPGRSRPSRPAVDQAKAQLASAKAGAIRADLELKRQQDLATRQINSRASLEQAQANYDQAVAAVQSGDASIESALATVDVLKAQQEEASRTLQQFQTSLAKAERDLSFTVIRAPFDGVVGNRAMQVGDYVQPTQRLASLVPLDAVYIDANFKETQVSRLQPGQPVSIAVDALPGQTIEGRVASFAPASGSVFSLLPPDNATGNFTKIVQRLPVRILVPAQVAEQSVLRPGMSVVVKVNTKPGAPGPSEPMSTAALRTSVR